MAPSATDSLSRAAGHVKDKVASAAGTNGSNGSQTTQDGLPHVLTSHKEPLKLSGALDRFQHFESTPIIGREFVDVDLAEWLRAPNSDDLIRDLAITISQRGVVFFRKQDNINEALQKELVQRLGELSGKPSTSKLHIHPITNASRENSGSDNEISVISSANFKKHGENQFLKVDKKQSQKAQWHSDITFEPVPSDYTLLRMTQLPKTGGDTLWASGYEMYDRISPPLQRFFESMTATFAQPAFKQTAEHNGQKLYSEPRGAPENIGDLLEAIHPVIRTNPVTGWNSVFAAGLQHVKGINGLSEDESDNFLNWFIQLITENHDLQVRNRWQFNNDMAIWDNRSVFHAATPDYQQHEDLGERAGSRAVSCGERPYFDPQGTGRRAGLAAEKAAAAAAAQS